MSLVGRKKINLAVKFGIYKIYLWSHWRIFGMSNMIDYKVPYEARKKFCKKIREIESQIQEKKDQGKWVEVIRLKYTLYKSWWGYKRYKK